MVTNTACALKYVCMYMYDDYSSLIWISSCWFGTGTKCDLIKLINGIPTVPWVNDCLMEINYLLMRWWCLFCTYQHAVSCIIIVITHWTINTSPKTACCSTLDTLFWLKSSSYYSVSLSVKTDIVNIIVFGLIQPGIKATIYRT